jgi:hypothetical protein
MKSLAAVMVLVALSCALSFSQVPAPAKKAAPGSQKDCGEERAKAFADGWNAGSKKVFSDAARFYSTAVDQTGKQLNIQLLVEQNLEGADSYRLAAAEVARTHFSDTLAVVPSSRLALHITGVGSLSLGVSVRMAVSHTALAGDKLHFLSGALVLAEAGVAGGDRATDARTQSVRELTYKVLSEFLEKWQKAAKEAVAP